MRVFESLANLQAVSERLKGVRRWSQYKAGEARTQTTLDHTVSIAHAGIAVTWALKQGGFLFRTGFVMNALALHDVGEGCRIQDGTDVLLSNKTSHSDLLEYQHFLESISAYPTNYQDYLLSLYLLQYVGREKADFDDRASRILKELSASHEIEARIFQVIERLDYVLYAYQAYAEFGNVRILVESLRSSHAMLKVYAKNFSTFGEIIYTSEVVKKFDALLAEYTVDGKEVKLSQIPNRHELPAVQPALPFPEATAEQSVAG